METYKLASEVTVGDKVVESSGTFFEVISVERRGQSFLFGLRNMNGYMVAPTSAKVGARKKVRVLIQQ